MVCAWKWTVSLEHARCVEVIPSVVVETADRGVDDLGEDLLRAANVESGLHSQVTFHGIVAHTQAKNLTRVIIAAPRFVSSTICGDTKRLIVDTHAQTLLSVAHL